MLRSLTHGGAKRSFSYWGPPSTRLSPLRSEAEFIEAFGAELSGAVERRLVGKGPVALAQSGGLDSGSVLCLAARLGAGPRLVPLHAVPEERSCQELSTIRLLEERTGVSVDSLRPDTNLAALRAVGVIAGEPRYLDHFPIAWRVVREVAARGIPRLLTGLLGDIVSGAVPRSAWLAALLRAGNIRTWWSAQPTHRGIPRPRAIAASLGRALPFTDELLRGHRARLMAPRWVEMGGLHPEAVRSLGLDEERNQWLSRLDRTYSDAALFRSDALRVTQPDETEFIGRAAHALGFTAAHPFTDPRLVALSLALPPVMLRRENLGRYPLRAAMAGILPEALRIGTKKVLFDDLYLRMFRSLLPELARRPLASALEGLVCPERIRALVGLGARSYSEGAHVWRCLAMNNWILEQGDAGYEESYGA